MSLRFKLTLIAGGLTLAGLGLGLLIIYWSLLGLRLAGIDSESRLLAEVILEAAQLRPDASVRVPTVVESYLTDESGVSAAQLYRDGQLIWEGGVLTAPRPLDPGGLLGDSGGRTVADWRVYSLTDPDLSLTVQVGRPLQGTRDVFRPYAEIALPLTVVLVLLAALAAYLTIGLALRPLSNLANAAGRFDDDAEVPVVAGNDEVARLTRNFAALLGRLKAQRQRELRFLAYAAHELRTPLSALRAGLEHARQHNDAVDGAFLERLHREAKRLETLAQNLLALSRAEMGETRRRPLDLEEIAAAAYDRFQPLALEKGLELELTTEPAVANGDPRLLEQALDNLLANAVRCTARGQVIIRSGTDGDRTYLEVADSGPGLPTPLDEGLGLRVVRAVAAAHGGELELASGAGTRARLWLPAAGAAGSA